ncbi:MAG: hypothetical protein H6722_16445 [Sandaracinus sp.]|nr:hypothetical protein [Sandaracinus sp.]MCB9614031.1 hypothetical protein [Sandaracinus sp.]MCB9620642.1 hypothetical protein [Sandaracinus sp.]
MRVAALALLVGCVTPSPLPVAPAPRPTSHVCPGPGVDGWTLASGDVSRLPTPSWEPISEDELWRADYPSAQNVQLRRVRRAHVPESSRCVDQVPRWEWGWVAVVPETCAAFVSVYGVWWPVEAYGPPVEPTICERFDEAYPWGMDSRRRPPPRARALRQRCPLEFAPRGAVLPPRARAAVAARRREYDFGWNLLRPPIRSAFLAFSQGDDAFASFVGEQAVLAESNIESELEGAIGERDLLMGPVRDLRDELARRPTDTTSTSVRRLRDLAAHPGPNDETDSHREDPRFRAVVAEGSRVLPELEACIADEGPRTRYVVADPHRRWTLVPHADLCRAAREEILTGTPAYTWWDFARDFREVHER